MTLAATNGNGNVPAADILKKSVTKNDYSDRPYPGVFNFMLPAPMSGGLDLPPFWTPARDWVLYSTLFRESMWSAAISIAISKIVAMGFDVDSEIPLRARRAQNLFLNMDAGRGYVSGLQKHLQSFLLTDNGGAIEIVRASSAAGSRIIGLVPLDTFRTLRTGDPDIPAIYQDLRGGWHEMKDYEVILLSDMPDQSDRWYGVGHCLHRESYVRMADGSSKKIAQLVKEQSREQVASVDADGYIVSRAITGWHENPISGRRWVNVRGKYSSRATGKVTRNLDVTEEHPILTPSGWVQAIDLKDGDAIVTEAPTPNRKQIELIVGSVLGDMSLLRTSAACNTRMSEGHNVHQHDWLTLKTQALSDFGFKLREYKDAVNAGSRVTPGLNSLRERCYPKGGKKSVPVELVQEYLSPLLLATWYMDDGWITDRYTNDRSRSARAHIGNSGADYGGTDKLAQLLNERGYECTATKVGPRKPGMKDIHFTVKGSQALWADIAPYVPECMRYKLPYDALPFDLSLWDLGKADRFVDEAVVKVRNSRSDATVFCLDVEDTHNFISSGIVVHNCAAERAYKNILKLESIERYVYEKVSGQRALSIYLVNGIMPQQIDDGIQSSKSQAQAKGVATYLGATIIGLAGDIPVTVAEIPLAELPDGFNRKEEWDITMNTYARCIGIAVQDLQPLSGQGLGTGTQSQVLDEAAKGQGLAAWRQAFEHAANEYALDDKTTFYIKTSDIRDRERESIVSQTFAATMQSWFTMGMPYAQIVNYAVDNDQMPPEYRVDEDLTPGEIISDDEKPDQLEADDAAVAANADQQPVAGQGQPQAGANAAPQPPANLNAKAWRDWTAQIYEIVKYQQRYKETQLDAGDAALKESLDRLATAVETETQVYQESLK